MRQLVFNSYPRSGNVYSGHASSAFIDSTYATVHIPEIFCVEDIINITIFRKPEDAISSLINKQLESSGFDAIAEISSMDKPIESHINLYRKYMNYAEKYKDLIYIGKFDDLIGNTVLHFENVAKRFEIELLPNYKKRFSSMSFSGRVWEDRHDGHLPREKDDSRLKIEKQVALLPNIQKLNKDYLEFIGQYATIIE